MNEQTSNPTSDVYKRQTQHRVEYETLYRLVLNKIRECAKAALMDGEAVAGRLTNTCEAEQLSLIPI